jgi:outer membrane protein assembly factor BamA
VRGSAGASFGSNPQTFYVGGVDNWINASYVSGNFELKNPEDFAFLNSFVMPLRGWPVFKADGSKFAIANFEYRFPILMAFATGGIPLFVQAIMGNAFFDIGASWNDTKTLRFSSKDDTGTRYPENVFMSAGWGLRAIVFGLPFRFDMAWRNNYSGWSSPYYLFSLGIDW